MKVLILKDGIYADKGRRHNVSKGDVLTLPGNICKSWLASGKCENYKPAKPSPAKLETKVVVPVQEKKRKKSKT